MPRDNGGAAFPSRTISHYVSDGMHAAQPVYADSPGMDLRDYFAAQALVGFLADSSQRRIAQAIEESPQRTLIQDSAAKAAVVNAELAAGCYALADAMLAARTQESSK